MKQKNTNTLLITAIFIALAFHGSSIFFTLESTYDALIHLFFADHYANSWFDPWDYRWYTGFSVQGYPPLVHQSIALLSYIGGLKFGMFSVALIAILLFITGAYRFGLLLTSNRTIAGYTALLAVFSSTFVETLHIFGQLPSIIALSILLHSFPEIYEWLRTGERRYAFSSLSLIAVTVTSHHVTPIFGMVFFIFPLIGMAIMDEAYDRGGSNTKVTFKVFWKSFKNLFLRIVFFGFISLLLIIFCILPYWINSKNNPITQVPIPHGSRDNFLEVTSSGLVFFIVPWGILLFILPYFFYRFYSKRLLFFGISFTLLTILGTGGTTPIPLAVLGETAFNILTLDRFTLWATIMALPIFGEFMYRMVQGDLKIQLQEKFGAVCHRIMGGLLVGGILFMVIFTMSLGYFRPSQPQKLQMTPIINFLNQDQHDQWRYLPLGFGDQMAWLSAQTKAMTVDGNYHSARRLPELTSRAVERLENSKFRGVEGIGSLQQFLTVPEKYNLKYVFSNDKFYDPLLYFCGWHRLQRLENGIMVWEKLNIPPLPKLLAKDEVSTTLKLMWGIIPMVTVLLAFLFNIQALWFRALKRRTSTPASYLKYIVNYKGLKKSVIKINLLWCILLLAILIGSLSVFYTNNATQTSPENVLKAYYDALDFKEFERAYSYIDPESGKSITQFMLEVSVTDGILSSYAKLDAISVAVSNETKSSAIANVGMQWITPLEKIAKNEIHRLVQRKGSWYIEPKLIDLDIPPGQIFSTNTTPYYNHGKRKISTQQEYHSDELKQPVLKILSARLVHKDSNYAIIGELQNVDNLPADIVISATLYNDDDDQLAKFNAKHHVKHKLMPKETTPFKVLFEGIAWTNPEDHIPATFNPDEFTKEEITEIPIKYNLQCAGNIVTTDLYKSFSLQHLKIKGTTLTGTLFNSGVQEVTIPQLLVSYYNIKKELIWVSSVFMKKSGRIQRKQYFKFELDNLSQLKTLKSGLENCFVNGLENTDIENIIFPRRNLLLDHEKLQAVNGVGYAFIKIDLNGFIGNPR